MRPTLAVLITYYNEKDVLSECLRTLWPTPDAPDEILIYDDASVHWPEEYVPSGCPAKVIHSNTNRGPNHGRNELLEWATTDYIHFHDSDDLFAPGWASRVRGVIAGKAPDAIFTEIAAFDEKGSGCESVLQIRRLIQEGDLVRFCLRGSMLVPSGTFRREIVKAIGGYRECLWQSEDYDFHVRLSARGLRYEVIPDPLVYIRLRTEGRSRKHPEEVYSSAVKAVELLADELPTEYRLELAEASARFGRKLYELGNKSAACRAFNLAQRCGPPKFYGEGPLYRLLASILGQDAAEMVGHHYRRAVPAALRRVVR